MVDWFEKTKKKTNITLNTIKNHPFIIELMNGSLHKDVFFFYINQDALYLSEYKKILASVAIKCNDINDTQFFLDAATGIINVEKALHQNFIQSEVFNNIPTPTCEFYTSYLSKIVTNGSLEEALAVVLPCFTIYKEIGDYILKHQKDKSNNPYQEWINTYGGEDFERSVNKAIEITNKYAKQASPEVLKKMELVYSKAAKLEWMFWDSAYNKEQWKI